MQFGINKYASLVVRGEVSRFLYNSNPTFYLSSQELPKTNCYTYLGVPFSNDLVLKPIIQRMNNTLIFDYYFLFHVTISFIIMFKLDK